VVLRDGGKGHNADKQEGAASWEPENSRRRGSPAWFAIVGAAVTVVVVSIAFAEERAPGRKVLPQRDFAAARGRTASRRSADPWKSGGVQGQICAAKVVSETVGRK